MSDMMPARAPVEYAASLRFASGPATDVCVVGHRRTDLVDCARGSDRIGGSVSPIRFTNPPGRLIVVARRLHYPPKRTPVDFHGIITVAPAMNDFFALLTRVARSEASVLIRGETGTGKELVARALHTLSPRARGPFKAINCATLTAELLASELFGHVRGSFTGAVRDRQGLFALADGGVVFLDEVAELPLELQARLLRVLQERSFVPLGGSESVSVNVRVLSATHRALREEVELGRFREDLMYRLRVVPLFLPRLKEREGDVEALTWHFIHAYNQRQMGREIQAIDDAAMHLLLTYDWPGNVRELQNNIEYAFAVGEGEVLRTSDLTPELRGMPYALSTNPSISTPDAERQAIVQALNNAIGNRQQAAENLGMSRSTLWRKMREYGIHR